MRTASTTGSSRLHWVVSLAGRGRSTMLPADDHSQLSWWCCAILRRSNPGSPGFPDRGRSDPGMKVRDRAGSETAARETTIPSGTGHRGRIDRRARTRGCHRGSLPPTEDCHLVPTRDCSRHILRAQQSGRYRGFRPHRTLEIWFGDCRDSVPIVRPVGAASNRENRRFSGVPPLARVCHYKR